jgi:hypothetical protein
LHNQKRHITFVSTKTVKKMKTTTTNQQAINLINRAFDTDGYLVNAKSRKNQNEAKQLLESGINFYGELVNGCDTHNCLLIIAYPNKSL